MKRYRRHIGSIFRTSLKLDGNFESFPPDFDIELLWEENYFGMSSSVKFRIYLKSVLNFI